MKQKNQLTILAVLLFVTVLVWYLNRSKPAVVAGNAAAFQNYQLLAVDNPQLHREKMESAQKAEYRSYGRNPFSEIAPVAAPEKKVNQHVPQGPPILPPPPPPTLPPNLKFFGYGTVPNGSSRRAFFSDGEEVYILAEGDTLLGRFRIVKINNGNLEFEEISSGRRNTVTLTQDEQATPPA